jgi:hypothetical protein
MRSIAEISSCGGIAPSFAARMKSRVALLGDTMRKIFAAAAFAAAITLAPALAHAQERAGDAALGALSGAIVGGPIGLVAGGVVGWTAGPSIARSWGLHRHSDHRDRPKAKVVRREANHDDQH